MRGRKGDHEEEALGKMEVLKKLMVAVVAFCVLTVSAWAFEQPQKNDNRQPPPDKKEKVVPKGEKPPPPPRNENRGNDGKKGRP